MNNNNIKKILTIRKLLCKPAPEFTAESGRATLQSVSYHFSVKKLSVATLVPPGVDAPNGCCPNPGLESGNPICLDLHVLKDEHCWFENTWGCASCLNITVYFIFTLFSSLWFNSYGLWLIEFVRNKQTQQTLLSPMPCKKLGKNVRTCFAHSGPIAEAIL